MAEMRQFVYANCIGDPPKVDENYQDWCPKCGRRLTANCEGYGLAGGGGMGHYMWCSNPRCDWFYKMLDGDENGLSKPSVDGSGSGVGAGSSS